MREQNIAPRADTFSHSSAGDVVDALSSLKQYTTVIHVGSADKLDAFR
jgi:hypothetical protein